MEIPIEIVREISTNLDIFEICKGMILINHDLSELCKRRRKDYIQKISIIQNFYKKHPPIVFENVVKNGIDYSKILTVRGFIASYPMKHLLEFPEFLIKKIINQTNEDKINTLDAYIQDKMPILNKRTRRDIKDFLSLKLITYDDLSFCGW